MLDLDNSHLLSLLPGEGCEQSDLFLFRPLLKKVAVQIVLIAPPASEVENHLSTWDGWIGLEHSLHDERSKRSQASARSDH